MYKKYLKPSLIPGLNISIKIIGNNICKEMYKILLNCLYFLGFMKKIIGKKIIANKT